MHGNKCFFFTDVVGEKVGIGESQRETFFPYNQLKYILQIFITSQEEFYKLECEP